ncbi:putative bifunctional diguanylate cyclase/phosphodiesterase [Alteromonas lipolytica]|uniref:Diguanylate cyclase n=1 Tax=Alteromonas lipolytica TaxID=1856405 RepID=A0A1E8F952_9ALTE|nr:bifunctional diguanylate cyclase/phosphodiesterase [Alteromonas lipolytica]OFI32445.1 hypothetical protein BFC17_06950 [Alteromonas lipolytica]GGF79597.1 hypothetical protein GCM10011338_34920 [Alteromonas lipolytica]
MQSDSTGIWYFECDASDIEDYLLHLQSRSVIYPDECEYLIKNQHLLSATSEQNTHGVVPLCHRCVTLISKDNKVEIVVNRDQEKIDHVTQLPLRVSLLRQIGMWYEKDPDAITGICLVELDGFSDINDTIGHAAGDLILFEIARRLERFKDHPFKLVRLHGDEFALAVTQLPSAETIWSVSKWICDQFEPPFMTQKGAVFITPSVGIALNINTGKEPVSLLESSYIALNHAKDDALVKEKLFNPQQGHTLTRQVFLEAQLNQALTEEDALVVWYQPKQDLHNLQINGLEALIRWNHEEEGLISPGEFIPLAERTGLICSITDYVVRQTARDLPVLRQHGFKGKVSINISANDFVRPNLVESLLAIIEPYDIDTGDIELEITEGAFISDFNHCIFLLNALKEAGFALSIDDFGTGYSSLSYLTKLPVDTIKIDMSFVRELARSEQARQIYKGMIDICKAMHFDVLAEGVDDDVQREVLATIGCDRIQGYLLSKPLALEKLLAFLSK